MRGEDLQQSELFSYGSLEERVPGTHPLRAIRSMVDEALKELSSRFDEIYGEDGRKSIPPERLLRAVVRYMAAGHSTAEGLNHYATRLLAGFLRHLQISAEFYGASPHGVWWETVLAQIQAGIDSTQNCLSTLPASQCRLLGFTLQGPG